MDEAEFDKFAAEYRALHAANIRVSGEDPEYFAEYKVVDLKRELEASGGNAITPAVLDFGAGVGYSVPFLRKHMPGARITCLDVSRKSLDIGAAKHGEIVLRQSRQLTPCNRDRTAARAFEARHHHQKRGFSRARRPDDRGWLPGRNIERDAAQDVHRAGFARQRQMHIVELNNGIAQILAALLNAHAGFCHYPGLVTRKSKLYVRSMICVNGGAEK